MSGIKLKFDRYLRDAKKNTVKFMILSRYRYGPATVTHRRPPLSTVTERSPLLLTVTKRY